MAGDRLCDNGADFVTMESTSTKVECECRRCGTRFQDDIFAAVGIRLAVGLCPTCEKLDAEECERRNAEKIRAEQVREFREKYFGVMPKDTRLVEIPAYSSAPEAVARLRNWSYGRRGLMIHGSSGKGKTRLLWLLLDKIVMNEGKIATFYRSTQLRNELVDAHESRFGHSALVRRLSVCPLLAIDDIGKEKASEAFAADLFEILEARAMQALPTICTTNHTSAGLAERFSDPDNGAAIIRRLKDLEAVTL